VEVVERPGDDGNGAAIKRGAKVSAGGIRQQTFGKPAQVYDWGEKGKIAEKLFSRIAGLLAVWG